MLSTDDIRDIAALRQAHEQHPFYGTRRLALHLGWNRKRARRIRTLAGVVIPTPAKKRRDRTTKPGIDAPPNILQRYAAFHDATRPQDGMVDAHAWMQDFTYLWFERRWHYLAVVLDLKTRQAVGWTLGTRHTSELTLAALTDAHQLLCGRYEVQLSASNKASPWQNGFMERWFGNFKAELGPLGNYRDVAQLYEALALQVHYYNTERIHTALKMSPAAYAATLI